LTPLLPACCRKRQSNSKNSAQFNYSSSKILTYATQTAAVRGQLMVDEKVKIKCTKCSQVFRERAQRIRNGFQTNCQHCNRLITFDSTSDDRNIRKALTSARELRLMLEAKPKNEEMAQGPVTDRSQV
jgi:hypothetical protein